MYHMYHNSVLGGSKATETHTAQAIQNSAVANNYGHLHPVGD
jgi:hypothetical protein